MATIIDVAEKAGLSIKTVSRVINGDPTVKEQNRERVQDAIKVLGYRPNRMARHMRTMRSDIIGIVTDHIITTPFAIDIIRGAQAATYHSGKSLFTVTVNDSNNFHEYEAAIEKLLEHQVDGIIYGSMYHRVVQPPPNLLEVPSVLVNCFSDETTLSSFVPDEVEGGYVATKHLLEQGHRRIGFLNLKARLFASHGRLRGYQQALAAFDIPFDEALVVQEQGQSTANDGYLACQQLLARTSVDAIFCGNDRMAMGAYDFLREHNLKVPEDISVVGFDNQEIIAEYLRPSLTTVALPHYEMGRLGVEAVIQLLDEPETDAVHQKVNCPLVIRQSTKIKERDV